MSKVYRFHGPPSLHLGAETSLLRKRKRGQADETFLIASDFSSITDATGTRLIETYREDLIRRPVTLTRREADLIALANPGVQAPVALEDIHPWLPHKPFSKDSVTNYRNLVSTVRQYGHHLVTAAAFCDEKWNTVCNAIRRKNNLDARFYTAWHLAIQDVHILEERRPDRSVVAIDFNAMYSACMQHFFPKPASLQLVAYDRTIDAHEELPSGLYRCILHGPTTDFIRRHNPFRSFFSGRHLRAGLSEPLEVDLNEFEITFYRRHFDRVHVVDAVVSDENIPHPLAKEVLRSFARRKNYRAQGNKALADREKYLSTLMSSCANRPIRVRSAFQNREDALEHLRGAYGISPPDDEPEVATDIWLQGRKGITVTSTHAGTSVDAPALYNESACFLLGQRVVARGRILLLEMMEKILATAPDVQICYTNIDSIHFSLPTSHLEDVMSSLRTDASDEMGSFKIEAVTRYGLWLEPGRYWLYSDGVEKFRNRSVGDRRNPFKAHAVHVTSRLVGNLHIPFRATLRMDRTMSDSRTLIPDPETGLTHQRMIEVDSATTFLSVLDALEWNQQRSTPTRLAAFAALEQHMSRSLRLAATRRSE
jgi:hypothetical protein